MFREYKPKVELKHVLADIASLVKTQSKRNLTWGERTWGVMLDRRAAELMREWDEEIAASGTPIAPLHTE